VVSDRRIAVALHDIEPATFEKCALIRDWLADHGIDAITLLVIPAADGHPFYQRCPELQAWLRDRRAAGDAIAQHGFRHCPLGSAGTNEFAGLRPGEVVDRVMAGRRLMTLAGLEPNGFVSPAYSYPRALRQALRSTFDWWATVTRCCAGAGGGTRSPALHLSPATPLSRALSPLLLRAATPLARGTLRLDLYPAHFAHPRHVYAVGAVLQRARDRTPVTYDKLLSA
jgi:predicted deacetylase